MDRATIINVLIQAAQAIELWSTAELRDVWNLSSGFIEARERVLPLPHERTAPTYIETFKAFVDAAVLERRADIFDNALVSIWLAAFAGLDDVSDAELKSTMATLFEPPLAVPGALEVLKTRSRTRKPSGASRLARKGLSRTALLVIAATLGLPLMPRPHIVRISNQSASDLVVRASLGARSSRAVVLRSSEQAWLAIWRFSAEETSFTVERQEDGWQPIGSCGSIRWLPAAYAIALRGAPPHMAACDELF